MMCCVFVGICIIFGLIFVVLCVGWVGGFGLVVVVVCVYDLFGFLLFFSILVLVIWVVGVIIDCDVLWVG